MLDNFTVLLFISDCTWYISTKARRFDLYLAEYLSSGKWLLMIHKSNHHEGNGLFSLAYTYEMCKIITSHKLQ